MSLRLGLFALTVSALALATPVASAETRAVVVGVSDYPALKPDRWLKGPRGDSVEVARTLIDLGVDPGNVKLLADGARNVPEGIGDVVPGTKAAILSALDKAVEDSRPGDLVVFYFSGHGSQQPDFDGDEGGGADEIFLPYDVVSWSTAGVENGLVDDELNERVQKILAKGANFFGMVDACHSATGFRAAPGAETSSRYIDPSELGVPPEAFTATVASAPATETPATADVPRGRAAFFYAAQENEAAIELPAKNGEEGEFYGIFTYHVLKRLRQNPAVSYRTLHQSVVNDIKRGTMMQTQTPEIEGELIDEPAFGLSDVAPTRQWPIFSGNLRAGELSGFIPGTVVALFDDPADPEEKAVARGVVTVAGATKAVVEQADWPCEGDQCSPDAEAFKKARFARVAEPGLDFSLSLSEPVRVDPADGHDYAHALAALDAAVASPSLSNRVAVRADGYDIAIGLVDGKLAFSTAAGLIDPYGPGSSPRLTLPDDPALAASEVSSAVRRIAQSLALQRLAIATDGGARLGLAPQLSVRKAKPGSIVDGACSDDDGDYEIPVPAGDAPSFDECDIVSVALDNKGNKALDVTVLLVGADFSITTAWPQDGASNRVRPRETKTADILQMEASPATALQERLVVIAVPGINQSHTAFDNLDQEGLRAGIDPASPNAAAARDLLAAGLTDMTRSTATGTEKLSEELAVEIRPFLARKGGGS